MSVITREQVCVLRRRECGYRITGGGATLGASGRISFRVEESDWEFCDYGRRPLYGKGAKDHRKAVVVVRQSLEPNAAYAMSHCMATA